MAKQKQKLELTWIGKDEEVKLEPRILIEDPAKSYGDPNSENMLIHGDNLLALKALEQDFAGKIKCIYIDPPYNTGSAFEHYDDNLEHSIWLNLMKSRLEILKSLLSEDGIIAIQIDDNEGAYLKVMLDEIFGRNKFINSIAVTMSNLSGPKIRHARTGKRFPKIKETIFIYAKNETRYKLNIPKIQKADWDNEYNLIIPEITKETFEKIINLVELGEQSKLNELVKNFTLLSVNDYIKREKLKFTSQELKSWQFDNAYRIVGSKPNTSLARRIAGQELPNQALFYVQNSTGDLKLIKTDYNQNTDTPRLELLFAEEMMSVFYGDLWLDIATTGGIAQEGGVSFPKSKKPEKLVARIIETVTLEGEYVLDSFLGSGTTAAVAHKLKRRWIGIELGGHANTHCVPRLKAVIDGTDQGGISKSAAWKGGGGFKFYNLAPSLLKQDRYGNWVIDEKYNATMLAHAVCKHEGFRFEPHDELYWKQGKSTETDFIFVTTNYVTVEQLDTIHIEMLPGESLLICAKSFAPECESKYPNITTKKIPKMILGKCEFGKENYDLNIIEKTEDVAEEQSDNN